VGSVCSMGCERGDWHYERSRRPRERGEEQEELRGRVSRLGGTVS